MFTECLVPCTSMVDVVSFNLTSLCGVDVKPTLQKRRLTLREVEELALDWNP